jgi:hypothetical protein
MTPIHPELLLEFAVILLAPIIHTYYLWKVKKVDASVIRQNIKIFSVFLTCPQLPYHFKVASPVSRLIDFEG